MEKKINKVLTTQAVQLTSSEVQNLGLTLSAVLERTILPTETLWIPSVTDVGILSWRLGTAGDPGPSDVNIKGARGDQGPQGPQGPQGNPGDMESWQANGAGGAHIGGGSGFYLWTSTFDNSNRCTYLDMSVYAPHIYSMTVDDSHYSLRLVKDY